MVSDFDEYAALARHLHDLHRTGQAGAAHHVTSRQRLTAHADQLGQRLYAQRQRLAAIGQAAGEQVPAAPPPVAVTPAAADPAGPAGGQPRSGGYAVPPPPRRPEVAPGPPQRIPLPSGGPPVFGGPATPGGLPVPGAPSSAAPAAGDPVPGGPAAAGSAATVDGAGPTDPEQELAAARQRLDEADAAAYEAEQAAGRPPLLPGWSPLGRAVAVYLGFAVAVAVLQFTFFLNPLTLTVDYSTKWIWSCSGFPAVGFFAAYFVISKWGRSRWETDGGPRFPKLGFLISFGGAAASMVLLLVFLKIGPL
ncbi:hypothetical protein ACN27F_30655 [Solwaraspora sp. WMMB335]|uniref:hypothetical protein n=1 Tax=Solwaraspora sp. WMMB335 TaxID=3404118 RepID=UPI003B94B97C